VNYLKQEKSTSKNIKSDATRHAVQDNLETAIQILRQNKSGGFALFVGRDRRYLVQCDTIPWYYRCDKVFITSLLQIEDKDLVGCIAMDVSECAFGYLSNGVQFIKSIESGIQSKHRAGGQSSQRFKHLREEAKHNWFKRIAEYAREYFLDNKQVKYLVVHGESFTKAEFLDGDYLEYRLQKKATKSDGCYAGHDGLFEANNKINQQ
jgi:peptide chain release factor subunit 1